jgi:Nuclease-related domain
VGAVVHGRAGQSVQQLDDDWQWAGWPNARRGAFFEQRVAQVLHHWLTGRPDEVHVFHDLVGLTDVTGAGLDPSNLGGSNIDHLVLAGREWLMIDAKGCGAGSLRVESGKGVLVGPDGNRAPQPWMDNRRAYSRAGVPYRLTDGKGGVAIWVLPQATAYDDPSVLRARFLSCKPDGSRGEMCLMHDTEIADGALDELLPIPAAPADPRDVQRLHQHVSAPDIVYRLPLDEPDPAGVDAPGA